MPTVTDTIEIAKVSQYLATVDAHKRGLLYNGSLNPNLPVILWVERKIIEKINDEDPTYTDLQVCADYLYSLCGAYALKAQDIISGGGGGSITPVTPVGFGEYLIPITSSDFANATDYNNPDIVGKNLVIFWNDINRYLIPVTEWNYTVTGFEILIDGFDATSNDYTLFIYIINP